MTSEGLGEMFEGDSADTCAGKFLLTSMGAERRILRAQTRERGPYRREWNSNIFCYFEKKYKFGPFYYYYTAVNNSKCSLIQFVSFWNEIF